MSTMQMTCLPIFEIPLTKKLSVSAVGFKPSEKRRENQHTMKLRNTSRKSIEIQARIEAEEKRRQAAADEQQLRETMEREARHARGDITDEPVELSAPASLTTEPVRPAEPSKRREEPAFILQCWALDS